MAVAMQRPADRTNETCLIIGGSSGLGRCLAERFARGGYALALVSSDERDTRALASDLRLRFGVPAETLQLDLGSESLPLRDLDATLSRLPPLTVLLAPAGRSQDDDQAGEASPIFDELVRTNFTNICRIIAHYVPCLTAAPTGLIVGFGSVAAVRGRTRNAAYGAAKRALHSYFESLQHALAASNIRVQFYVLGYLDTNLAFAQRTLLPPASPSRLADCVYRRRSDALRVAYYPRLWQPLCAIVRAVPWALFRRLSF